MGKKNSRKKRGYHYSLSTLVLVHRKRFPLFCSCVSFLIVFFFFFFFFFIFFFFFFFFFFFLIFFCNFFICQLYAAQCL